MRGLVRFRNFTAGPSSVDLTELVARSRTAALIWRSAEESFVDKVFQKVALDASTHRIRLAQLAVEETGRGVFEDKVVKNLFATENPGTTSLFGGDPTVMQGSPYGVIAALCPVTNPTSTALYKALLALRTRNAMIVCPHPSARVCTAEAVELVARAAVKAGAPENLISVMKDSSKAVTNQVMNQCDLVWATGR